MLRKINEDEDLKNKESVPSKRKRISKTQGESQQNTVNGKKLKFEKVKPPTLEEINELKETRNLFHSNLFRLQVKEMLEELKIKPKYTTFLNSWLERFQKFIDELPSQETKEEIGDIKWLQETPFRLPLALEQLRNEQRKFNFQFIKPTSPAYFIGAAATDTLLGPKIFADVCVTMPASCFQKENYLNLIYDQKRAMYLVYIANQMLNQHFDEMELHQHFKFNYHANNPLKPVLVITPPGKVNAKEKISIRIFIAAEETSFKLGRFVPWTNNIRRKFLENTDDDESVENTATPHYNANVLFDLTMESNHKLLSANMKGNKNFQEALVLLKVWIHQRQLHMGYMGFSTHIFAMFICYLQSQRKIHQKMSSYQVVRTVWNQLAHSTWDTQGISLCSESDVAASNRPTLIQFHEHYEVVFVDATGYYNICSNLSLEIYKRVRLESKLAVELLNDMKVNSFQTLFMTKYPLYAQLDHILKISNPDAVEQILEMYVPLSVKQDFVAYTFSQLLKVVASLLQKGLGQRVQGILPIEQDTTGWPCTSLPDIAFGRHLQLGFILHPIHAYEVLDKGPESIDNAAEEFRRFWGDKAQLRRFQDGTITESVVWASTSDTLAQKRLVSRSIVLHLLQHHFQLEPNDVVYIAGELDIVYKLTPAFKTDHMPERYKVPQDIDAESLCLRVIRVFDDLAKKLHALKELPLEIVSIVGTSPVFRYCEPSPLLPQARVIGENMYAGSTQRGIIQLASSGKWPNELPALQAMKTAFYIQIAQLLREKHKLETKVTYDGTLIIKEGYCFNIEIAHPKELALLKETTNDRGIKQYVDTPASMELEKRHYVLPKVTGAIHALHHQNPSLGGTIMIAKRWLYSQLIDTGLWPEECTELLVALLYLRSVSSEQITCSPQTGFIRFLQLIGYSDYKAELFLLNFNNSMDENQISELEQRFNSERNEFPPLCIATAYDRGHYGKLWTSTQKPTVNVIARVALLAREALEMIETSLLSSVEPFTRPSRLFVPSNQGYDLVIQIKPEEVPNATCFEFGSFFLPLTKPNWRLPLAGTDFLGEAVFKLRESYGDFAAFFYNPCGGGKVIGVVWKPDAFNEKDFKVNEVQACQPINKNQVKCCRDVLIEDFKFILKDFYLRIDTVEAVSNASREAAKIMSATITGKSPKERYFSTGQKRNTSESQKKEEKIFSQKKEKFVNNKKPVKVKGASNGPRKVGKTGKLTKTKNKIK